MAASQSQQDILKKAREKKTSPDELLQNVRANLKGPGDSCKCMPAFTCLYCSRLISAREQEKRKRDGDDDKNDGMNVTEQNLKVDTNDG